MNLPSVRIQSTVCDEVEGILSPQHRSTARINMRGRHGSHLQYRYRHFCIYFAAVAILYRYAHCCFFDV